MALNIFITTLAATLLTWLSLILWGPVLDYQKQIADLHGGNPCTQTFNKEGTLTDSNPQAGSSTQPTRERIHQIREKYDSLFWRQPNVFGVGEGTFRDADGNWTETKGIVVLVSKKVAQSTLPTANRIPACLDGVPIQIFEDTTTYGHFLPPAAGSDQAGGDRD